MAFRLQWFETMDRYEKLSLRLPLQLARRGHLELVDCVTETMSSEEVRFVSPEVLLPDEQVEVDVALLAPNAGANASKIHLQFLAQVEGIEPIRLGSGFRVDCRIKSYNIKFGNAHL